MRYVLCNFYLNIKLKDFKGKVLFRNKMKGIILTCVVLGQKFSLDLKQIVKISVKYFLCI